MSKWHRAKSAMKDCFDMTVLGGIGHERAGYSFRLDGGAEVTASVKLTNRNEENIRVYARGGLPMNFDREAYKCAALLLAYWEGHISEKTFEVNT